MFNLKKYFNKAVKIFFKITDSIFSFLLPVFPKGFQKWFRNWKPIHLCRWFIKNGLSVPRFLVGTAWDVSTASYDSKYKSVHSEEDTPGGLFFKPDGTKMYVVGDSNNTIYQYSLSSAWDVSTASFETGKTKDVESEDYDPRGLFFNSDGTKMYVMGGRESIVFQYSLSSAWDVSTATYDSKSKDVSAKTSNPYGLFFKPDGTRMYIMGKTNRIVYQYALSTAWDVSTASYSKASSYYSGLSDPCGLFFKPDGTKMYMIRSNVRQFALSTAWDVSTASYETVKDTHSEDSIATALFFKPDGTKMYMVGTGQDTVFQYSLPVVVAPTVTTQAVSSIEKTTATGNGNITDDGGDSSATRGMCWNTSGTPTISDNHATNGTGEGSYTVSMTGLSPGTHYYVRAYSTNSAGTSYGSEVEFDTKTAGNAIFFGANF